MRLLLQSINYSAEDSNKSTNNGYIEPQFYFIQKLCDAFIGSVYLVALEYVEILR